MTLLQRIDASCGPLTAARGPQPSQNQQPQTQQVSSNALAMAFFMTGDENIDAPLICKDIQTIAATRNVNSVSSRRIVIIANADLASCVCQLALRKIIESRSVSTLFIITSMAPMGLDAAIISRCTLVNCNAMGSQLHDSHDSHNSQTAVERRDESSRLDYTRLREISLETCRISIAHLNVSNAIDALLIHENNNRNRGDASHEQQQQQQCDTLLVILAQPKLKDHAFRKAISTFLASPTSLSQHQQHDHRMSKTKAFIKYILNHEEVPDSVKLSVVSSACIMDVDVCALSMAARKDARITNVFVHRFFWSVHCVL
jgi:hypothetical protein